MPTIFLIIPLVVITLLGSSILMINIVNRNSKNINKVFVVYWSLTALLEIINIIFYTSKVQFIPPSIAISWYYGSVFFIVYFIQCIFYKIPVKNKIIYIIIAFVFNYFLLPISLVWL